MLNFSTSREAILFKQVFLTDDFSHMGSRITLFLLLTLLPNPLLSETTMTWGELTVTAEELGMERKKNLFFARGEVKSVRGESTLNCDEAIYDQGKGILKALGNVVFTRGKIRLNCGFLILFENEKRGIARMQPLLIKDLTRESFRKNPDGSIPIVNSKVALRGEELEFFHDSEILYARGDAVAIEVPSFIDDLEIINTESQFLNKITADIIEIYGKTAKSIGRGNVKILTEEMVSTGEKGIYLKDKNRLIITGNALVYQSKNKTIPDEEQKISRVRGDKIVVFPETNQTIIIGTVKSRVFQTP